MRYAVALLLLATTMAFAQNGVVTGRVTAQEDSSPIPGVNVLEKGTNNGTVTDADGNYRISVGGGATLVFSFVGYQTMEVAVSGQSSITVALLSDVTSLSEVVVVGYGTQDKKELTSSVSSLKAEDFNRGTVNDPAQLLQGKVAGLNISRAGGDPNGTFNIRLRGIGTIGANAQPLIVIDGVIGGSLSTVDPNDIASFDVLKDGSAAAIYGSRGGSGVILITTKSGKAGKTTVEYSGSVATQQIANRMDFMTADEYRQVPGHVDLGSSTDWLDEVTRTGTATVHNLSLGGGNENTTYRASMNYRNNQGINIGSGFDQLNARLNLTQKAFNKRATFNVNLSTTQKEVDFGFTESMRYAVIANPTMPVRDNTTTSPTAGARYGGYAERDIFDFFNPLSIAEQNVFDGRDTRLLMSVRGEYDFSDVIDGFKVAAFYSSQREYDMRHEYYAKTSKFRGAGRNGLGQVWNDQRSNDLFELTGNYNKQIGGANINILGGYSYQTFFNEGYGMLGGNFLVDDFSYNNMGASLDFQNGLGDVYSYANSNKLIAFFGRVNVNIAENYFISAAYRHEGSSRFGENNKWGPFPAVSAGVTLSNLIDMPAVNTLKLRASYGTTGNQPIDSYLSIQRVQQTGSFYYNGGYINSYGYASNANPNLKWETKNEIDIGLDFALLNNKLTGTIDYYTRDTKDLILPANVAQPPNLFNFTWVNIGEMRNSGVELSLNYAAVSSGDFTWSVGGNVATYKNTMLKLGTPEFQVGSGGVIYRAGMGAPGQNAFQLVRVKEGETLGQLWGPVQEGVNADGTPKFSDLDGSGSYCDCDADKTVIGNGLPKATVALNNTFTYKGWDLNIFLRSVIGHDLINSYRGFYENLEGTTVSNYNVVKTKYYDPTITKAAVNNTHVEKASFVRLDNATLGYNVSLSPDARISRLRLYLTGQNLFTITGYTGVDPEPRYVDRIDGDGGGRPATVDDGLAQGIERRSTYFTSRTYTFGLNLTF